MGELRAGRSEFVRASMLGQLVGAQRVRWWVGFAGEVKQRVVMHERDASEWVRLPRHKQKSEGWRTNFSAPRSVHGLACSWVVQSPRRADPLNCPASNR